MSSHIPFHIELEIIKRLPVKSLIRFISVCKAWKSLIDSSECIAAYSVRHTQPQHLLIMYRVGDREEHEQNFALTDPPLVQGTTTVIGSSHGLLCLIGFRRTSENDIVVLWNPAIRKSISVVVPDNVVHCPFNYVIGFGVCPDTKDPKLVKITYIDDDTEMESISCIPCQVMVFTLSSRECTCLCSSKLPRKSIQFTRLQTVIGWFIYWIAYDWTAPDFNYRALVISFDMSTEEFREVNLPDSLVYEFESDMSLSRLRESLVLLDYIYRKTTKKYVCDVWMMEHGDPKVFTKLFTITAPNVSVLRTLGFRNSGEPIVELGMLDDYLDFETIGALVVYEPCSQHIRDLAVCGITFSLFANSYTESLILLDHDDGHVVRCEVVKR